MELLSIITLVYFILIPCFLVTGIWCFASKAGRRHIFFVACVCPGICLVLNIIEIVLKIILFEWTFIATDLKDLILWGLIFIVALRNLKEWKRLEKKE